MKKCFYITTTRWKMIRAQDFFFMRSFLPSARVPIKRPQRLEMFWNYNFLIYELLNEQFLAPKYLTWELLKIIWIIAKITFLTKLRSSIYVLFRSSITNLITKNKSFLASSYYGVQPPWSSTDDETEFKYWK